jgi:APA family basic amino acid/polyamine antiporter
MHLFRRIPIETLVASDGGEPGHLKKVLNVRDLIALGIGAIIGAGIFATLGTAASGGENSPPAGPAVTISIILTAVACGFCALCYAELAGLVPLAGSAYTYSYATLGELPAWIIGWDLIIEYAVGNIAVAISWAAYFRQLMTGLGIHIPSWLATDYRSAQLAARAVADAGLASLGPEMSIAFEAHQHHPVILGVPIICNLLAASVTAMITWLLVVGIKESCRFNNLVVLLKLATLLFFIVVGAFHVNSANWHPFFPGGFAGVWRGASLIFFAYLRRWCDRQARFHPSEIVAEFLRCRVVGAP